MQEIKKGWGAMRLDWYTTPEIIVLSAEEVAKWLPPDQERRPTVIFDHTIPEDEGSK